jgi:TDG/mug DNA glycosylase family protein
VLAILGVGAYRAAFARPKAQVGPKDELIGETRLWVLPNPSGFERALSAGRLAEVFAELRREVE